MIPLPCPRLVLLALTACLFVAAPAPADEAAKQPNVLFLLADDQAWAGTSVAMHPTHAWSKSSIIETPHVERLAKEGLRFSNAYAPSPMCASTRIAFQTGRSSAAMHWTKAGQSQRPQAAYKLVGPRLNLNLPKDEVTIGEMLQGAGYRTAHFGKWHLGSGGPAAHGYDESDGDAGNERAAQFKDPNPVDIFGMADRAIAFMKKSQAEKKPWFIQMSWLALHSPENALAATKAKYGKKLQGGNSRAIGRAAIAEDLDTGVGRLLAALDELGLSKTTYVIYTSDNGAGGGTRSGANRRRGNRAGGQGTRLAGGKGSIHEGGVRVPLIIRGPGVSKDAWCHTTVTLLDMYPTCAAWAGVDKLPKTLEGGSWAGLFGSTTSGVVKRPSPDLHFHFPHYQNSNRPQSAIRSGDMKLIYDWETKTSALYDLSKDLVERNDLREAQPETAKALEKKLMAWLKAVDAQLPTVNKDYDANAEPPERRRKKGGKRGGRRGRRDDR